MFSLAMLKVILIRNFTSSSKLVHKYLLWMTTDNNAQWGTDTIYDRC